MIEGDDILDVKGKIPSQAIFENVLDSVKEGILMVNRQGEVVLYNNNCARTDGLKREDVLGRNLLDVFPSLTRDSSILYQVMRTGKPVLNVTQTFTNFKGHAINIVSSSYPIYDQGKLWGALEISLDIQLVWETSERMIELQAELGQHQKNSVNGHKAGHGFYAIVTQDEIMEKTIAMGRRAARMECPLVVQGETGTGKELFVRAIHEESLRKDGPLISQNCAALPETLLEAALFGTTRGAFTGAQDRPGLFELADKGTLFLDEVISASVVFQAKLLRALEDMSIRRVGGARPINVDVRVVASLNMNPEEAMSKGLLREDFFYRIAVIYIELIPLRQRRCDIPLLAKHFLKPTGKELSPGAMRHLETHNWPGNVRELRNLLEGAAAVSEGSLIDTEHFSILGNISYTGMDIFSEPEDEKPGEDNQSLQSMLNRYERRIIYKNLRNEGGNLSAAARVLGLPRQTLWSKAKRLGIDFGNTQKNLQEEDNNCY